MISFRKGVFFALLAAGFTIPSAVSSVVAADRFEIRVIDRETRRGVPMVELVTVHDVIHVTDSSGRAALDYPEWAGQTIFFHVRSPGYQLPADRFGYSGIRVTMRPGGSEQVELDRLNHAERLYRITGEDIYLDSLRLGHETPIGKSPQNGRSAGQDSVQVAPYRNKLYWFWGDTNRLSYPLGLFRTAGATSPASNEAMASVAEGIDLNYFTGRDGFVRAMVDVANPEGVVWVDGVCTVSDIDGTERLVAHYSRRRGLADQIEHGILMFNDRREVFEVIQVLDLSESWRFIRDHPVRVSMDGTEFLAFGNPFPVTRVPATLEAIQDRTAYQSFGCATESESDPQTLNAQSTRGGERLLPDRDETGEIRWSWSSSRSPTTQQMEHQWLKSGLIQQKEARFVPTDVTLSATSDQPSRRVLLHSGTVFYNAWRQRWIMLAVETATAQDSPSFLGEVWFSEAVSGQGPFREAVKVATHPGQTFYNPCHHPFFDQNGGRVIFFEGTYCNTFTKSPATPRYNYNQLLYRLDLSRLPLGDGRAETSDR